LPAAPGQYEVRFFARDSYTWLGTSNSITVLPLVAAPLLTVTPSSVVSGQTVTATVSNPTGNSHDWIGLYRTDASASGWLGWKYIGDRLVFDAPSLPGTYELRLFSDDSYLLLSRSDRFTVK
jgi:hypothetical protein